ncbi:MAG: tyrosine-type recombinase/integrase [Gemmataceae bacterium]
MVQRMKDEVVSVPQAESGVVDWYAAGQVPAIIAHAGKKARKRFLEFFTATIRNENTRMAYARAIGQFFAWCQDYGLALVDIEPIHVAAYIERHPGSPPTVKQHLAAVRMLFDWLVIGQVLAMNPAASVRGPKHVVKRGKTPVLDAEQARHLLDSIDAAKLSGLRDRALIAVMVFSFARVSAAAGLKVEDYYQDGKRWWFRFREKGGKQHQVPAHHSAEAYLDAYLFAARIVEDKKTPLFQSVNRDGLLTGRQMTRNDAFRMVKRRAKAAGIPETTCNHTFRATGITAYLDNGGTIENAQAIAAHESPRTTKLYDRTGDEITLDEIEKILI